MLIAAAAKTSGKAAKQAASRLSPAILHKRIFQHARVFSQKRHTPSAPSFQQTPIAKPPAPSRDGVRPPLKSVIASGHSVAAPGKRNGGEDAHFIAEPQSGVVVTGVADGVGGWSLSGVDAGEYARELMGNAKTAFLAGLEDGSALHPNPKEVLRAAHKQMKKTTQGSCTACIVVFDGEELKWANLGDSGLLGWRIGHLRPFVRTQEQQHRWNCPFQLGHDTGDTPDCAQDGSATVHRGDVIVLATDGFFDNLFDEDIMALITTFMDKRMDFKQKKQGWPIPATIPTATAVGAAPAAGVTPADIAASIQSAESVPSVTVISPSASPSSSSSSPIRPSSAPLRSHIAALHTHAAASVDDSSLSSVASSSSAADHHSASFLYTLDEDELKSLAEYLVSAASEAAANRRAETPFAKNARRQGRPYRGGKQDDITVVVAQVLDTRVHELKVPAPVLTSVDDMRGPIMSQAKAALAK